MLYGAHICARKDTTYIIITKQKVWTYLIGRRCMLMLLKSSSHFPAYNEKNAIIENNIDGGR